MKISGKTSVIALLCGALVVAACGDDDDDDDNGAGGTSAGTSGSGGKGGSSGGGKGGTSSAGQGGTGGEGASSAGGEGGAVTAELTDGEILQVVETANAGEVEQGELAAGRAQDAAVVAFAELMVTEHNAALEDGEDVAADTGIEPEESSLSQMLAAESDATIATLEETDEAEFDLAYMQAQVTVHQKVLALLDERLIPQADDEALVTYLEDVRTHVENHLSEAEDIVADLE